MNTYLTSRVQKNQNQKSRNCLISLRHSALRCTLIPTVAATVRTPADAAPLAAAAADRCLHLVVHRADAAATRRLALGTGARTRERATAARTRTRASATLCSAVTRAAATFAATAAALTRATTIAAALAVAVATRLRAGRPAVAGHLDAQLPAVQHATVHGLQRVLSVALVVEPGIKTHRMLAQKSWVNVWLAM